MARAGKIWDDKLCAEHAGEVPDITTWCLKLDDIEEFNKVIRRVKTNFMAFASLSNYGSIARLAPLPVNDFNALKHFEIRKFQAGGKQGVIFINGFLSEGDGDVTDWSRSVPEFFNLASCYHLDWEASKDPLNFLSKGAMVNLGSLVRFVPPSTTMLTAPVIDGLATWHLSMKNAEATGRLLANAILRTSDWQFSLVGHSLGARVIHFALVELAKNGAKKVENAYLLGAAVGGGTKDDACWELAADAVTGKIFNCHSREDSILAGLYRIGNVGLSSPAGYSGIHLEHEHIHNADCTDIVKGHLSWKQQLAEVLRRLRTTEKASKKSADRQA